MQTLTLDNNLVAKLRDVKVPVSLQDEGGTVLGCFTPAWQDPSDFFDDPRYEYIPNLTREERERRRQQTPVKGEGKTLKQIYERLLTMPLDAERRSVIEQALRDAAEREQCDSP